MGAVTVTESGLSELDSENRALIPRPKKLDSVGIGIGSIPFIVDPNTIENPQHCFRQSCLFQIPGQ